MGNVNAREDDAPGSVVDEEEEEGGISNGVHEDEEDEEGNIGEPLAPSELMGQSPPHSPRATHSPLMFTPQVPVLPLQRPDEMNSPNNLWMHAAGGYEEICNEQAIPTMITWTHGGKDVAVEGSWDNWETRVPLQRAGKDYTIMKVLQSGVYQYRFIVEGQLRYAPDLPWAQDDAGNRCNILDLKDYVPEDLGSISSFEPPQSPEASYNNLQLGTEDYAKEPPLLPPHLQMTQLNVPSCYIETPLLLSRPQHVVINHLYMQKGKSSPSVVALGSTHRFRAKYVTVVLYKSLHS